MRGKSETVDVTERMRNNLQSTEFPTTTSKVKGSIGNMIAFSWTCHEKRKDARQESVRHLRNITLGGIGDGK
jgi:hypothetical protein